MVGMEKHKYLKTATVLLAVVNRYQVAKDIEQGSIQGAEHNSLTF